MTCALVLCGGLGTRLRAAVADVPKVLAPVGGRPFLDVLVGALHRGGVRRVVLCTGFLAEQVDHHVDTTLRSAFPDVTFVISREPAPLGTAGAIKHAAPWIDGTFLLVNGDTYVELDLGALLAAHQRTHALITLSALEVPDAERYGALEIAETGELRAFGEKSIAGPGVVNAGVYACEPRLLDAIAADRPVSLEREVLPALLAAGAPVFALRQPGSFVDIGTAESWAQFSRDLVSRQEGTGP